MRYILEKGHLHFFHHYVAEIRKKKRRGGTENVAGIMGFGKACQLASENISETSKLADLRDYFLNRVCKLIPRTELWGDKANRLPNTLNLGFDGVAGDTLLIALDIEGVAVSTGSACSSGTGLPSPVLRAMGIPNDKINSSIRFSLGCSISKSDLDLVVGALVKAVNLNKIAI